MVTMESEGKHGSVHEWPGCGSYIHLLGKWAGPLPITSFFKELIPDSINDGDCQELDFTNINDITHGKLKVVRRKPTVLIRSKYSRLFSLPIVP